MPTTVEIDLTAKALYLRLAVGRVADTIELADAVVADVDEAGNVLGIEFIRLDRFAPFIAAHPELVVLPSSLKYTSMDRDRTWQVEIGGLDNGSDGKRLARVAELNAAFLAEIIANPELVDRIADDDTVVLSPAGAPN